jgi:hypothetical protein
MAIVVTQQQPQIPPSSSGLTGRSSTPWHLVSIAAALEYWIPAFAGMTVGAGMTKKSNEDLT